METLVYIADTDEAVNQLLNRSTAVTGMTASEIKSDSLKELLRVFAQATAEVMATVVGAKTKQLETILLAATHEPLAEITGTMQLTGETTGTVAVSFNAELAGEAAARIAGCSADDLTRADICDGVGEITNQVSGRARTLLNLRDRNIEIDLPTVVDATTEPTIAQTKSDCYAVLFECLGHRFALQLCVSD